MSPTPQPSRCAFLQASTMSASGIATATSLSAARADTAPDAGPGTVKVRYDQLLPHEFRQRLAERPIAYLPLGTIEWHGEHLPLGSDALQSEGLMLECARRLGGIVSPPLHLGPDRARTDERGNLLVGMDYAETTTPPRQLDGSCYWVPPGLHEQLLDAILAQLKRAGFLRRVRGRPRPLAVVVGARHPRARGSVRAAAVRCHQGNRPGLEEPDRPRRAQRDVSHDVSAPGVGRSGAVAPFP